MNNKSLVTIIISVVVGALLGVFAMSWLTSEDSGDKTSSGSGKKEPLYWVAPMDPNYKRDKPGKSPMGMDLVPVYEENTAEDSPGTVTISSAVENNIAVRTDVVKKGVITHNINTVGYVQFDEDRLIHIHPRVEGWIEKLHVKATGNPVTKNQPLYELYSPQLVNAQEEYLLALKRNNRDLIQASEGRLRALQLSESVINELKKTGKVKQHVVFYSPIDGFINELNIREGFFVKPGTTMMSVGAMDQVWVEAEIFERQIGLVKQGLPVTMSLDTGNARRWQGKIDYVYPTLNPDNRTGRVRIRFDNPDYALKPNMFSQISIQVNGEQEALLIPREAVIRTQKQDRVVLALGEGKFKSIAVKLGNFGQDQVEIIEGLKAGDRIVTSAQFLIDSESSKSSDFMRMSQEQESKGETGNENSEQSVWIEATIKSVMAHHNMVTVNHGPVKEWGWPAMTMDLDTAEELDLSKITKGMTLHIQVTKYPDNRYLITDIHIPDQESQDHSEMEHSQMDHSDVKHEENHQ